MVDLVASEFSRRVHRVKDLALLSSADEKSPAHLTALHAALTDAERVAELLEGRLEDERAHLKTLQDAYDASVKAQQETISPLVAIASRVCTGTANLTHAACEGGKESPHNPQPQPPVAAVAGRKDTNRRQVPAIRKVTEHELNSVPQYQRGRLSLDRLNRAIDALDAFLVRKYRLLDTSPDKLRTADDIRDAHAYRKGESRDLRKYICFSDDDAKTIDAIRLDATGRCVLSCLRALRRIHVVKVGGCSMMTYALTRDTADQ
ncbi:unnamed protein product [Vitrella brassicaformis CCMP3155]|uniref:Spindle and kinetochore-associated protein 1 n=1 Tax=Vitrella brassicaformis (strain CCMP3155) TaxID=1169540 RepID=A0A0G4GFZ8_VITBC|nr:unnamed protein product [Vitrella brassicaformis CCMP3155]|mmetsp:Transcript_27964/g.69827  ORF Transcript_27964/g.69827 Transcript_27964/m.69827 type:complete len:262 (-) Transcript_27964:311-1096(-)|eukprot:CEM28276.1 unnamed protein product [Vitrella brassicaformis CCMP3155]